MESFNQKNPMNQAMSTEQLIIEEAKGIPVEQNLEILPRDSLVKATGMNFDFNRANRFWEAKHGIIECPLLLNERNSPKKYDNGRWKAIIQNDKFLNLVGRMYVTFPNEEVLAIVQDLIKADPSLKLLGEPKFTNHGLNMFVTLISDQHQINVSDKAQGDLVSVGVVIRNSLGGGMGLGADLFTYRLACLNGAIFRSDDLGNDFMRHYGKNTAKITEAMRSLINTSLERVEDVHQFYEKMRSKKLGEGNRKSIFKRLEPHVALKNYPDYVEVESIKINKESPPEHVFSISKDVEQYNMWKVFNDFTEKIWHTKDLRFEAKRAQSMKLHQIIIDSLKDSKVN